MSPQKLLVIVVVYNGMPWLERCLGSVSGTRSELLSAVDLFVVDNGSTDGSADFVAARFPEAMLVRSGQNLGFGRANNLGLQHAIENGSARRTGRPSTGASKNGSGKPAVSRRPSRSAPFPSSWRRTGSSRVPAWRR